LEPLEARTLLATCHVTRLGDFGAGADLGGGHSRGDLRYCINFANANPRPDIIAFSRTGTIALTGALPELSTDMEILGPGAGALTVRRVTGGDYRIFTVNAGAVVRISGLTISNGKAINGGGIWSAGALTLEGVSVSGNQAVSSPTSGGAIGGGIYSSTGSLLVENSVVSGNVARAIGPNVSDATAFGGGIYSNGTATINNSQIINNKAEVPHTPLSLCAWAWGGGIFGRTLNIAHTTIAVNTTEAYGQDCAFSFGAGIYSSNGTATVSYSTVRGNTASAFSGGDGTPAYGGGIFASPLVLRNSTIVNNKASGVDAYGGGISGANVTITDSTIANNGCDGFGTGGGISMSGVSTITNSTITGNYHGYGGGISAGGTATITHSTIAGNTNGDGIRIGGNLTLRNSIVANNTGKDIDGIITSSGYNLIGNSAGGSGYVPSDILDVDPMLGPLADNGGPTPTMSLLPGSPAIDAGDPDIADAPEWDQRGPGFPRIVNGRIDIGAYEVQAAGAPTPVLYLAVLSTANLDDEE
jgi:hypothetical protein